MRLAKLPIINKLSEMDGCVRWNGYMKIEIIQPTNIYEGWLHKWWAKTVMCSSSTTPRWCAYTQKTAHRMLGLLSLHRLDIHSNISKQTHKKTVIMEIRTQMHSHLGSLLCVNMVQECLFSICFGDYVIKMHWNHLKCFFPQRKVHSIRTLSQCKSYYSFFSLSKHITTNHVHFRLCMRPSRENQKTHK